jgi:uncharacterized membrane protein HdeD (DUF308 family)
MTAPADWRDRLFIAGYHVLFSTAAVWVIAAIAVNLAEPVDAKIRAGAWAFLIGSLLSIIAAVLIMFGRGWKQRWLVFIALIELPFWIGFTLY